MILVGEVKFIDKAKRHEIESIFAFHRKRTNYYWDYCLDVILGLVETIGKLHSFGNGDNRGIWN